MSLLHIKQQIAVLLCLASLGFNSGCQVATSMLTKHFQHCKKPIPDSMPVRTLTVSGEVRNPGILEFPEYGGLTIQKAIAECGGMGPGSILLSSAGIADPAGNGYNDYLSTRVVTLNRANATYIIPAEVVDSTEFGRIRLQEHDVVSVVNIKSLGLTKADNSEIVSSDANPLKAITLNGTTRLEQTEFTNAQLQAIATNFKIGAPLTVFTNVFEENVMKIVDAEQGPAMIRLTRYATLDGLPQIFLIPASEGIATELKNQILIRGGDAITYLPPGLDPLLISSSIAEGQTQAAMGRIRQYADQSN